MQDDLIQLKLHFLQHTQFFAAIIDVKLTLINKSSPGATHHTSHRGDPLELRLRLRESIMLR